MLVYADGSAWGTVGGGKFEALVIGAGVAAISSGELVLRTFPLHEASPDSFGAICGGEVTVFIEPIGARERIVIVGAGHCGMAVAKAARECGCHVTVLDDREAVEMGGAGDVSVFGKAPALALHGMVWSKRSAVVLVSRNFEVDRESLAAVLEHPEIGYIGMIGSRRKVERVFTELRERGYSEESFSRVYTPIGLDIGADSPGEIAISVMAEVLLVLRGKRGGHLRDRAR
jgi:xanthine dehydrogenase accessory factor